MAVHIIISGKIVQGIFFRLFIRNAANKLGINGFVRNLPNNTVEVHAEGTEKAINELVSECRKGPSGAVIEAVKVSKTKATGAETFEIIY